MNKTAEKMGQADREREAEAYDNKVRDLAAHIRQTVSHEPDESKRLSALIDAIAAEIVSYAHTGPHFMLDELEPLKETAAERLSTRIVAHALERIARDHTTVAMKSSSPVETLVGALDPGQELRRKQGRAQFAEMVLGAIRSAKED